MKIIKRNGEEVDFCPEKIKNAIAKAFRSVSLEAKDETLDKLEHEVEKRIASGFPKDHTVTVEEVQDLVEIALIEGHHYAVVKSYILYRASHHKLRKVIEDFSQEIHNDEILQLMRKIQEDFPEEAYDLALLRKKFLSFFKLNLTDNEKLKNLGRAALELTSKEAPKWEYIAARFMAFHYRMMVNAEELRLGVVDFYSKLKTLTREKLYLADILETYSPEEIRELGNAIDPKRDEKLNASGLELLVKRYTLKDGEGRPMEHIQEMFMGIAMHLAMPEKHKVEWAKRFYDMLSLLKVTMATPTMSNARKVFHQLSSCFIDTVPDSLDGIYRSITNFSQVSKHGGGMGLYFGKVRAMGSDIRGFEGAAGGVIRWIKLANDTAVAVDQLGVRQGACAVYLDLWHKDMPEFLALRTNNGDDRMKAHDVFPAISVPDYFYELARTDLDQDWAMFCPHEVYRVMGFHLEDAFGDEWKEKYLACVREQRLTRRVLSVKDVVRLIIKSAVETGTPFIFNRDPANRMNPNGHAGTIYSSNLCTEIMQNMAPIESISEEITTEDGEAVIVTKTRPGDFVVCNLASLVLGNLNLSDGAELKDTVHAVVRALDNVIDLNLYPVSYAKITNRRYRAIGLGTSGYHHALVKAGIRFSDEKAHYAWADDVYERINYYAIEASNALAREKGKYELFTGSDWDTGAYFDKRDYHGEKWDALRKSVHEDGLRNGYLLAVAPTGSTSIIAGTTAAVDPVMNRYFLEEKKGQITPRVAPELSYANYFLYENAHEVDPMIALRATGVRARHIDQSQSVNLYITPEFTMRRILELYLLADELGIKSLYYVRNRSLTVESCESCEA